MPEHTALLVVHGIGAQEPGETLAKLATGLRRLDRASVPGLVSDGMTASIGGREVRLYEVYWARLHKGEIARGAFDLQEMQALSWFPHFNWRRGCYRVSRYSALRLLWWNVVLPLSNFLVMFSYWGSGPLFELVLGARGKRPAPANASAAARRARLHGVDVVLDEYPGDVMSYVKSAGHAFYQEGKPTPVPLGRLQLFANVMARFNEQLVKASSAEGCTNIQIVAHSLGSVVAYHALSGFKFEPDPATVPAIEAARAKVSHLYTIGCPLEKIRFFWPRLTPRAATAGLKFAWDNFVSFFDPVSGRVKTFDDWGKVDNHPLLGGGFVSAHVVYEGSPIFLRTLAKGLCGKALEVSASRKQRFKDTMRLVAETFFFPVLLLIVLTLGVMFFLLVALMLPWAASWVARMFVGPETYGPIQDWVSLVLVGMMLLSFALAPWLRARLMHRQFWEE